MKTAQEIQAGLENFYGTEEYHRTMNRSLVMTDGVAWLCEAAGCYWLIDAIASHQISCMKDESLKYMQFWSFKKEGKGGVLICERDSDDPAIKQEIEYSDFPLPEIKVWVERGSVGEREVMVAMLPSER